MIYNQNLRRISGGLCYPERTEEEPNKEDYLKDGYNTTTAWPSFPTPPSQGPAHSQKDKHILERVIHRQLHAETPGKFCSRQLPGDREIPELMCPCPSSASSMLTARLPPSAQETQNLLWGTRPAQRETLKNANI